MVNHFLYFSGSILKCQFMKLFQLVVVFISLVMLSLSSYGQLRFGGKLGGASTNLTGIGLPNFVPEPKIKFIGGALVHYGFIKRMGLQAEFLYSGKGSAFSYTEEQYLGIYSGKVTMKQDLGYFAIPTMLQFKMGDRDNYFHVDGGLVFNFLVHEKFNGTVQIVNDKGEEVIYDYPRKRSPNTYDLGYAFGFGLLANGLNFDFRLEFGTDEVFDTEEGDPKILNKSFQVSVGYTFGR